MDQTVPNCQIQALTERMQNMECQLAKLTEKQCFIQVQQECVIACMNDLAGQTGNSQRNDR
jgi:hypothetical protein